MENRQDTEFASPDRNPSDIIQIESARISQGDILEMVLDATPNVFLVLNPHRQIILANRALGALLNIDPLEKIYGLRPGEALDCVHATDHPNGCGTSKFCSTCGAARAILNAIGGTTDVEECHILQRKSGNTLEFRIFATPFTFESGPYVFVVLNDIASELRRKALERIFFHDVLNIAGTLHNIAQIMPQIGPEQHVELTVLLERGTKRLIEEVQAHRSLLNAENNDLIPQLEPCNPAQIVEEVLGAYQRSDSAKTLILEARIPEGEIAMVTDALLLGRILGNLVKNAVEASHPGDTITVGYTVVLDKIRFFVQNPGVMPLPAQYQVFQRSFSTKGKGRGLGTYSVKLLAERYLGGRVSFQSSDEEGTVFFVEFPLRNR